MLSLNPTIQVANITRMRARAPRFDDDAKELRVAVEVGGAGGRVYTTLEVEVRNGSCVGIRATVSPVNWTDYVQRFGDVTLPTGYDDAMAALRSGATPRAGLDALESYLVSVGLLPTGTVS